MSGRRKRVLHVSYALDFGGVETHLRLIAETKGERFEHHFCALAGGGTAAEAIHAAGGTVHALGKRPWREPLSTVIAVRGLARDLGISVIHSHGADANLFGLTGAWLARTPLRIGEEVALRPHRLRARLLLRMVYSSAHRIVAVSDAVARHVEQLGEAPRAKIVRLYNPVQLSDRRAKPRKPGERLRIGFVGRLAPEKNPRALVEATAAVEDCELTLVGDGMQRAEIEDLVRTLGLEERVTMHGYVSQPDELLAACHVYAQPSLHEGLGIALVEAMSCGLPAIVSAEGGMREIVTDGENGWLLEEVSAPAIAEAVREAMRIPVDALAAMGASARRAVGDRFDPTSYVQKLETLYDDCLAERGLRTRP
jgi:glycosyltransferase involved in cell wall biosynthesis